MTTLSDLLTIHFDIMLLNEVSQPLLQQGNHRIASFIEFKLEVGLAIEVELAILDDLAGIYCIFVNTYSQ